MTFTVRASDPRRPAAWPSAVAASGALAFVLGVELRRGDVSVAALDASWLFFAGLAAGSVAVSAAIRVARGRWALPLLPIADAGERFFGAAFGLLVVLVAGAHAIAPWRGATAGARAVLALRQLVPTATLFVLGHRFVRRARSPHAPEPAIVAAGVAYLLAYAVTSSLWAYDWVLALWRSPPPTVVPAYYAFGAALSGLAWTALVAAALGVSGPDLRHDLGKLLFAFVATWAYLLWALFLATWYANLPDEVGPLLLRWRGAYRPVAVGVLVTAFALPFALLFFEPLKRRRSTLGLAAALVLGGVLAERFLLVVPSLHVELGVGPLVVGGGTALGVAALYVRTVWPHVAPCQAEERSRP